jgi:four helix bundle protein
VFRLGILLAPVVHVGHDVEQHPVFENGEDIRSRAFEFACRVVRFSEKLLQLGGAARIMAPQLVNCSTSIPAMLEEARAAESRRDFVSKCSIGLKEAREAFVRLKICQQTLGGAGSEAEELVQEATELVAILGAIIRNTRRNAGLMTRETHVTRASPDR